MAKINLLPWREAYRQEKKREFLGIIAGIGLAAVFGAYVWVSSVQTAIENQNTRNQLHEIATIAGLWITVHNGVGVGCPQRHRCAASSGI